MKYQKSLEKLINTLKKYSDGWKNSIVEALKTPSKYRSLKGAIFNYYVYNEIICSYQELNEYDFFWLINECHHGKFEWLIGDLRKAHDSYLNEFITIYNDFGNEDFLFSVFYRRFGLMHDRLDKNIIEAMNLFGKKIDRSQYKIAIKEKNSYDIFASSEFHNPLFLEQYALQQLKILKKNNNLFISQPASHCDYIDCKEGFSFFAESNEDDEKDGIGELFHFYYNTDIT